MVFNSTRTSIPSSTTATPAEQAETHLKKDVESDHQKTLNVANDRLLGRTPLLVDACPAQPAPAKPLVGPKNSGAVNLQQIQELQNQINRVETGHRINPGETVSTGCDVIDRLLPGRGYPKGVLVQWLSDGGFAADYLSLLAAKEACRDGGALVIIDPFHEFYPPAVAALGMNMANLIVLRGQLPSGSEPNSTDDLENDLLWSIDQSLRCPAVGAVWGPMQAIDERWFRRFQLSAESSGCLGLFLQPLSQARQPTWAEVQWLVTAPSRFHATPRSQRTRSQYAQLQLTRCRGTRTGKKVVLEIDTVSGNIKEKRNVGSSGSRNRNDAVDQVSTRPFREQA
ncbi:MAG: hypothetical protein AAFN77_06340 [Planctomycetota bacterium]